MTISQGKGLNIGKALNEGFSLNFGKGLSGNIIGVVPSGDVLELENSFKFLLESGGFILLEN